MAKKPIHLFTVDVALNVKSRFEITSSAMKKGLAWSICLT